MINVETGAQLLDFRGPGRSITEEAAREQLRGAVALHNMLEARRTAYLADEVGMGKTYVALGAVALFRHFDPNFRLLVVAPRENIQRKWIKELRNFVRNNVRFPDLRVKAVHGVPARQTVHCQNLVELVREVGLNPDRDFFVRLTSFSLPLGRGDTEGWKKRRAELLGHLPWADPDRFDLRSPEAFKDSFAKAVCAALPIFDLVIVDEGHNLKAGFSDRVAARNRVLALAFGHPSEAGRGFPGYGPRARRVLFLSATPLEGDYRQLWNQLDVFGLGDVAPELKADDVDDEAKRASAQGFLVRRVTSMKVGEERLTKNLYRREWRYGGVTRHDTPLEVDPADRDRQRLIVALVQKKVAEILGHQKFNNSFQIGMLASFESFLETSGVKTTEEDEEVSNFDDAEQTDRVEERQGIDVGAVNGLARSYRNRFGSEMPHPKMDALVAHLAEGLPRGRKALVFVRRVASVKELQSKLEERYDEWLFGRLRGELPDLGSSLQRAFDLYREEQRKKGRRVAAEVPADSGELEEGPAAEVLKREEPDTGGLDSFFAWFFRGDGPKEFSGADRSEPLVSGANVQRRFSQATSAYSTFFEDNYLARVLRVRPAGGLRADGPPVVLEALAAELGRPPESVRADLIALAAECLPAGRDKRIGRLHQFVAVQAAGLKMLTSLKGDLADEASVVLQLVDGSPGKRSRDARLPSGVEERLEEATLFTELRARDGLRRRLWPSRPGAPGDVHALREQELRRLAFSAAARLGHAFLDLYVLVARAVADQRRGAVDDEEAGGGAALIGPYLDLLERQMEAADGTPEPPLNAYWELRSLASHFDLIVDVNAPDLRREPLGKAARLLGTLFGKQQPIGGMFGGINQTLVRQFRLPGYPLVLVTTDLLQEGEDLHTFCSAVHHYGISWMPSSMEQRVGRIDRVNSETERRLTRSSGVPDGSAKLQVYYPHLRDTVEVLQVQRVLRRMDRFLRLMHEDLRQPEGEGGALNVSSEIHQSLEPPAPITRPLKTAFPIREELLEAPPRALAVPLETTARMMERFKGIPQLDLGNLPIRWEDQHPEDVLLGTVERKGRQQPFSVLLRSYGGRLMVRCVSSVAWGLDPDEMGREAFKLPVQVSVEESEKLDADLLSTEDEVLLGDPVHDAARIAWLIDRVTAAADHLERKFAEGDVDRGLDDFRGALEGGSELAD